MARSLDLDLLRTLVAVAESGGFTRAGERLHRTQSAVSLQIRKLEENIGSRVFHREGRNSRLTETGELLLGHARRLLAQEAEALLALEDTRCEGELRFGCAQPFADGPLADTLAAFARLHPRLRFYVRVDSNAALVRAVEEKRLDLALVLQQPGGGGEGLAKIPLVWLAAGNVDKHRRVALALFEPPCLLRDGALGALKSAGLEWEVVFTSPSLPGLLAAARAGLGVTAQTSLSRGPGLCGDTTNLPPLPTVEIALHGHPTGNQAAFRRLLIHKVQAMAW